MVRRFVRVVARSDSPRLPGDEFADVPPPKQPGELRARHAELAMARNINPRSEQREKVETYGRIHGKIWRSPELNGDLWIIIWL